MKQIRGDKVAFPRYEVRMEGCPRSGDIIVLVSEENQRSVIQFLL